MAILLAAKGSDITVWRAAGDFTATFRQALLNSMEFCGPEDAERLLKRATSALEELASDNDAFCQSCDRLIAEAGSCYEPALLRGLATSFYAALYEHAGIYHSAAGFYQASTAFLRALAATVRRQALTNLGQDSGSAGGAALIALGTAGRQEFSPCCPLQLVLVHAPGEDADSEAMSTFGQLIHEGFEACGLMVDGTITPRNPQWRGTVSEWRQRMLMTLGQPGHQRLIDVLRLADQSPLISGDGLDTEFRVLCTTILQESRAAMSLNVSRAAGLSHGIGLMGGFRLEKRGPYRGMFAILENGLQPFSAALSALALLKGLDTVTTPQRIRECIQRRELNVDMTERLLLAWHALHELRLDNERRVQPDWANPASLYLELDRLDDAQREALRDSLETVASLQRHLVVTCNGMVE